MAVVVHSTYIFLLQMRNPCVGYKLCFVHNPQQYLGTSPLTHAWKRQTGIIVGSSKQTWKRAEPVQTGRCLASSVLCGYVKPAKSAFLCHSPLWSPAIPSVALERPMKREWSSIIGHGNAGENGGKISTLTETHPFWSSFTTCYALYITYFLRLLSIN